MYRPILQPNGRVDELKDHDEQGLRRKARAAADEMAGLLENGQFEAVGAAAAAAGAVVGVQPQGAPQQFDGSASRGDDYADMEMG